LKQGIHGFNKTIDKNDFNTLTEQEKLLNGFSYLLSMPISSLIKEQVNEILKERDDKKKKLEKLISIHIKQIWLFDLEKLEKAWKCMLDDNRQEIKEDIIVGKKGKHNRKNKREYLLKPNKSNDTNNNKQEYINLKIRGKKKTVLSTPKSKQRSKFNSVDQKYSLEKKLDDEMNSILNKYDFIYSNNSDNETTIWSKEKKKRSFF